MMSSSVGCGSWIILAQIGNLLEYYYGNLVPRDRRKWEQRGCCQGRINRIRCLIRYSRKIRKN